MKEERNDTIMYTSSDSKEPLALFERDDGVWHTQKQRAESSDTAVTHRSMRIKSILKDKKLNPNSVVKNYVTTAFKTQ